MTDDIATLADEYQQFRYRQNPMWAHMSGEYSVAGSYTDVSAAGEEAAVAEAREFLSERPYLPAEAAQQTVAVHAKLPR